MRSLKPFSLLFALVLSASCGNSNTNASLQEGEACESTMQCSGNLVCLENTCKKAAASNNAANSNDNGNDDDDLNNDSTGTDKDNDDSTCKAGYTGANCDKEILCKHGTLDTQTGHCSADSCQRGWAGEDCAKCAAAFSGANCDQCKNSLMTGENCDQCKNNKLGSNCDIDTVVINGQTWTAKNMYDTTGNDGSTVTCDANTSEDSNFVANYGCLYTWDDAMKVCPTGWHLPTKKEFDDLLNYVGGANSTGCKNLRATSWNSGTDKYGFSALPAGRDTSGSYHYFGSDAYFWSSTMQGYSCVYFLDLYSNDNDPNDERSSADVNGCLHRLDTISVRCVKD